MLKVRRIGTGYLMSISRLRKIGPLGLRKLPSFHAIAAIVLGAVVTQPVYAKKAPLVLKPSSNWIIEYEEDSCRLIRTFGVDDEKVVAIFNRYGPNEDFRLTLAGGPVRVRSTSSRTTLQFGPVEAVQKLTFSRGSFGKDMPALIFSGTISLAPKPPQPELRKSDYSDTEETDNFREISAERRAATTYLSVDGSLRKPIQLALGPMDKPLGALSTCVDELMTHWGIDVEKHKKLSRSVVPDGNPGKWIIPNDYPMDMLLQRQPALVQFRLSVDETGAMTECHIQKTTRPKEFDDAVCESLARRAKFLPALDENGKAIKSFYRNAVRFQIP